MLATKNVVRKEILKNVSGVFKPGSGKSALMKTLSGRFPVEKNITVEGEITYNGQVQQELKKVLPQFVAYVNQRDKHYPTLTVKETLEYAHTFSGGELTRRGEELLSQGSPEENKAALETAQAMFAHYPEVIIKQLGLQKCQDTIVGDAMLRGVSGGERKRVTTGEMEFGMKYVTLMDEISTGLDSAATFDIINTQRSIAKKLRKTVVIALLQPSPEVFSLFDDVMILNAGEVMYHGPREQIVDYFEGLGFECPPGRDIADYLLDLGTKEQRIYEVALPQQQTKHPRYPSEFAEVFRRSSIHADMLNALVGPHNPELLENVGLHMEPTPEFHQSFWESTWTLIKRESLVQIRNTPFLMGRAVMVVLMGLLYSTTFYQVNPTKIQVVMGVAFSSVLFLSLSQVSLTPTFMAARDIFYKQRSANFFRTLSDVNYCEQFDKLWAIPQRREGARMAEVRGHAGSASVAALLSSSSLPAPSPEAMPPRAPDRGVGSCCMTVLTSPGLFRFITTFMRGLPLAVLLFESSRVPAYEFRTADVFPKRIGRLPQIAVAENNRKVLEMLYGLYASTLPYYREMAKLDFKEVLHCAAFFGQLELLEWLVSKMQIKSKNDRAEQTKHLMKYAVQSGNIELLEWVHRRFPGKLSRHDVVNQAGCGELAVVKWIFDHQFEYCGEAMYEAARYGRFDIVCFLHERSPEKGATNPPAMDVAAKNGHLGIVEFLHHNRSEGCSMLAMNNAAAYGYLEIVQFLHEHRSEGCSTAAMNCAARGGHLDVVRFLHENRYEGCTTSAMDYAARYGHLEIVQFLHDHRAEGCSTQAMDDAAKFGHFHIVQFLHHNRREGCSTNAMDAAAARGDLDILKFLHDHRNEGCTTEAIDVAAANGHSLVVHFLTAYRREGFTHRAIVGAMKNGHSHLATFLTAERAEKVSKQEPWSRKHTKREYKWISNGRRTVIAVPVSERSHTDYIQMQRQANGVLWIVTDWAADATCQQDVAMIEEEIKTLVHGRTPPNSIQKTIGRARTRRLHSKLYQGLGGLVDKLSEVAKTDQWYILKAAASTTPGQSEASQESTFSNDSESGEFETPPSSPSHSVQDDGQARKSLVGRLVGSKEELEQLTAAEQALRRQHFRANNKAMHDWTTATRQNRRFSLPSVDPSDVSKLTGWILSHVDALSALICALPFPLEVLRMFPAKKLLDFGHSINSQAQRALIRHHSADDAVSAQVRAFCKKWATAVDACPQGSARWSMTDDIKQWNRVEKLDDSLLTATVSRPIDPDKWAILNVISLLLPSMFLKHEAVGHVMPETRAEEYWPAQSELKAPMVPQLALYLVAVQCEQGEMAQLSLRRKYSVEYKAHQRIPAMDYRRDHINPQPKLVVTTTDPEGAKQDQWNAHWMAATVTLRGETVLLLNIYAPSTVFAREAFYRALSGLLSSHDGPILCGGDFNCTLNQMADRSHNNHNKVHDSRELKKLLQKLDLVDTLEDDALRATDTRDVKAFHRQHHTYYYTLPSGDSASSRLDRWYCSNDHLDWVRSVYQSVAGPFSDHNGVTICVAAPDKVIQSKKPRVVYPLPKNAAAHAASIGKDFFEKAHDQLDELRGRYSSPRDYALATANWWDEAKIAYLEAKKSYFARLNQGYKKKIQRLQRRLSESEVQMLDHSGGAVSDQNVELSQEFLTTATSFETGPHFSEHMHHERKTSKSFYKRISTKFLDNTIFTLGGTATCGPMRSRELADDMGEGWKSIMQQAPTLQTDIDQTLDPGTAIPPSDRLGFLLKPIDSSEIKQAVKKCKRGKAHGPDELGNDWYRDHCDEITGLFERLFSLWIPECVLPSSFSEAHIHCIKKSVSAASPLDYRPIALLNSDCKIFTRIFATRLRTVLPWLIHHMQAGFVPGRAIPTTIDVLLAAQQRATSDPAMSRAIALLLDFAKAYDSIDRSFLAQALQHLGFPLKFVHLVKVLHSQTTYKFIVNGFLSREYNVTSGIRQGCPLAPLLFILALEAAGCATEVRLGGYADDTTIYLSDPKDISAVFAILDKYGAASGLRVNRHKSAVLPLNKEFSSTEESVSDIHVLQREELCRYLGIQVGQTPSNASNWSKCIQALRALLASSTAIVNQLHDLVKQFVWGSRNGKPAKPWMKEEQAELKKMNEGLSVPNIRTELTTMSATAVSKWAITTSHIDQVIGEILLHNTRTSSTYITPLDAIPRRPPRLRDNMWTTGAALCASLHSRPYEPRERDNVRWCYEHFKSTILQTQWDGDVFQTNLSSKMSDRLPGIIAEGRKLRGTFCAEWLPYMTSTADGWLLDSNGSPYKLAHTSLSVGTAQLSDILRWEWIRPGVLNFIPTCGISGFSRPSIRALERLCATLVSNFPQLLYRPQQTNVLRLYNGQRHYNHEWHLHTSEATLTHVDTTLVKATHTVHSAMDCDVMATRDLNGQKEKADLSCSNPECSPVVQSSVQHLFWECPKAKLVWNYFYALWAKIGITPGHDPAIWIFRLDLPDTPRHAWTTIKRHIIGHKFSNEHLQDHLYPVAHMLWRYMSASLIQAIWCAHLRRVDSDPIKSTAEMAIMMTRLEAGMRNLTRLAEAQAGDSDGHTVAAVLEAYVDCFLSQTDAIPLTPNDTRGVYLLFFDGGSRGNPGPGGTGSIIVRVHKDSHTASLIWAASMAYSRKDTTNNFAEYWGLIHGLREAQRSHFEPLYVIGDSALIISQQRMHRSPRQHRLARLYQTSRRLTDCIDIRGWYHHYRAFNKMADSAANLTMDTRTSTQVHFPTHRAAFNNLAQDLDNDVMHWLVRSPEDPRSLDNTRQPHIGPREHAILVKDYLAVRNKEMQYRRSSSPSTVMSTSDDGMSPEPSTRMESVREMKEMFVPTLRHGNSGGGTHHHTSLDDRLAFGHGQPNASALPARLNAAATPCSTNWKRSCALELHASRKIWRPIVQLLTKFMYEFSLFCQGYLPSFNYAPFDLKKLFHDGFTSIEDLPHVKHSSSSSAKTAATSTATSSGLPLAAPSSSGPIRGSGGTPWGAIRPSPVIPTSSIIIGYSPAATAASALLTILESFSTLGQGLTNSSTSTGSTLLAASSSQGSTSSSSLSLKEKEGADNWFFFYQRWIWIQFPWLALGKEIVIREPFLSGNNVINGSSSSSSGNNQQMLSSLGMTAFNAGGSGGPVHELSSHSSSSDAMTEAADEE
ncbi:Abc transporter g family member 31, partial [Globisporangium splendens]